MLQRTFEPGYFLPGLRYADTVFLMTSGTTDLIMTRTSGRGRAPHVGGGLHLDARRKSRTFLQSTDSEKKKDLLNNGYDSGRVSSRKQDENLCYGCGAITKMKSEISARSYLRKVAEQARAQFD